MERPEDRRLKPSEVEMILRRAAELNARRKTDDHAISVSPAVLLQVAAAAGIPESCVRRALWDLASEKTAEPHTLAWKLYGPSRLRAVREVAHPSYETREYLEGLLRDEQGLKLRRRTEASSLYDAGDLLGAVRRALDFSGHRSLLKARSVELRVEAVDEENCGANLTADVANQRGEYLSLGGILSATCTLPVAIAGVQDPLFFVAVLPALVVPTVGFRLAYRKACADIRRTLDELLDAAEEGPPVDPATRDRGDREPGHIQGLKPIPRFTPQQRRGAE